MAKHMQKELEAVEAFRKHYWASKNIMFETENTFSAPSPSAQPSRKMWDYLHAFDFANSSVWRGGGIRLVRGVVMAIDPNDRFPAAVGFFRSWPSWLLHTGPADRDLVSHWLARGSCLLHRARRAMGDFCSVAPSVSPAWWGHPFVVVGVRFSTWALVRDFRDFR